MKVGLIVHDMMDYVGHSRYTKALADGISKRHPIAILANRFSFTEPYKFYKIPAIRLGVPLTVFTFPFGLKVHKNILRQFDILHAQGYCGSEANIVTAHICVAAYLNSLRKISIRHRISLKFIEKLEKHFYEGYESQIICVSKKVAQDLVDFYKVKSKFHIIYHGVDNNEFNILNKKRYRNELRRFLGIQDQQFVALYVGDLTKAYCHLRQISDKAKDIRFIFVTDSKSYRWSAPNVLFVSRTSEISKYYAASDAFIFPSLYDAFGMVVLEAMASGIPVFCSDQAGVAEIIRFGHDGFVFSLDSWVQKTIEVLHEHPRLDEMGIAAAETAAKYSWSSVVTATEKVYNSVYRIKL